jgi:beta-lactamase class A
MRMRFLALLSWFAVLLAQPAIAQVSPTLQTLEQRLRDGRARIPASLRHCRDGPRHRQKRQLQRQPAFPMASTMKIAVAAAYLAEDRCGPPQPSMR